MRESSRPQIHIPGVELGPELGHGAHSIVYRGRQGDLPCAVKVPKGRGHWTRWVYREAVALARVRDPGLPKVLEVGEEDGLPYLVMELVEGETLAERLRRGPLPVTAVIGIAERLVSTLRSVHDAGLIHRDVKPRNLVLEPSGQVRLVDFGFATPSERSARAADTAGTPGYAAPEQMQAPARIDGRADLYATGRVLYECVVGRLPDVLAEDAQRSDRLRQALCAGGANASLAEVVVGLLCVDPDRRYPDARAVLEDLNQVREAGAVVGPLGYEPAGRATPFVGRSGELQRILRAAAVTDESGGHVMLVQGARGSGKSRLLGAAASRWRQDSRGCAIAVSCREGDPPLATPRRILEGFLSSFPRASGDEAHRVLREVADGPLASLAVLVAPALRGVLEPGAFEPQVAPAAFAEGAAELLVRIARRVGRLLVSVDDLQWIDPASREVLVRVAHRTAKAPLCLVLAARQRVEASALERFTNLGPASTVLELPEFDHARASSLVAAHLGVSTIEPGWVSRVLALSDGTPLGILEVLGAFLDVGALRPHAGAWRLDPERAERVALPVGALALLGRRLVELPAATVRVLETAAVTGSAFEDELVARAIGIPRGDLEFGLADARRAGLVQAADPGCHRFVHDSLRELLVGGLDPVERRRIHQHIAEALDSVGSTDVEALCATAEHYAAGDFEASPRRVYAAARAAARAALDRFDNVTVIRFLDVARRAADAVPIRLDESFWRNLGEAQLRIGALDDSVRSFEAALGRAERGTARAEILGRIAWVHQSNAQPGKAWSALDQAFRAIADRMPVESGASAAGTAMAFVRGRIGRLRSDGPPVNVAAPSLERALRCDLHYQNARLGLEYNKPLRLLQSAVQALEESEALGPSRIRARALAIHGFTQTALGRRGAGTVQLDEAVAMAERVGDPVTRAFCVQLQSVAACFAGDFDAALRHIAECLDERGHWLELSEFCHDAANADLIESLRGRPTRGLAWIQRAVDRVRRSDRSVPAFTDLVVHRARACMAAQGLEPGIEPWLAEQIEIALDPHRPREGFCWLLSWGARIRVYTERGDLGPEFEDLIRTFVAEKHNPKRVHPVVVEYYTAVAHARCHQALRASPKARSHALAALDAALADLRASAKLPLFVAHCVVLDGYAAWLRGNARQAAKHFAEADALAVSESTPWVSYAAARGRAHMLRDAGKLDAARDQALVAETLAREHGAEVRARWVREEFELPSRASAPRPSVHSSGPRSSGHTRRQLTALLQVVRAGTRYLAPEQQAVAILDEVLRDVDADRAFLWYQPDLGTPTHLMVGRTREGETTFGADPAHETLLRSIRERNSILPIGLESVPASDNASNEDRVLGAPLSLHDRPVGAFCVERTPSAPTFGHEDRELLMVLAEQVPIALEVGRLLAEREQLHATLQQAQKMEAVGQLAGGVAHDFNNMLLAIQTSLDRLRDGRPDPSAELSIIAEATGRAAELTSKLLAFSRHKPVPLALGDLNGIISGLEPMLKRLVGDDAALRLDLDPSLAPVRTDRASFEQAVVNLAVNARDAMQGRGQITIATTNEKLDESALRRGARTIGDHVMVAVSDTGQGMADDVRARVFEPFFTTKGAGKGTGLGLATVYAFVKNCGGHIEVTSEVGRGSTFRLYFPEAPPLSPEAPTRAVPVAPAPPPRNGSSVDKPRRSSRPSGNETILVVDDEELVAKSIRRMLESGGYEVLVAHDAGQAFALAEQRGPDISLVILDMIMPDVSGSELGRRLLELRLPAKLMYVSGYSPESAETFARFEPDAFLEKPFSMNDLLGRVRLLLDS